MVYKIEQNSPRKQLISRIWQKAFHDAVFNYIWQVFRDENNLVRNKEWMERFLAGDIKITKDIAKKIEQYFDISVSECLEIEQEEKEYNV